jgi:hypothetical protein
MQCKENDEKNELVNNLFKQHYDLLKKLNTRLSSWTKKKTNCMVGDLIHELHMPSYILYFDWHEKLKTETNKDQFYVSFQVEVL